MFFVLWSDKEILSVNLCTGTLSNQIRCRGSLHCYTDCGFGWDNAGLCDSKVGLEGCSSWVARLGPHPHTPLKHGAQLSHSAGVLLEHAHPCVIVQSFIDTSSCQKKHCKSPNLANLLVMGGNSREPEGGRSPLSLNNQTTRYCPSAPPHHSLTFQSRPPTPPRPFYCNPN